MILITGATGTNGKPLIKALIEKGQKVRALVRNKAKAADLQAANLEIVEGDLADLRSLKTALQGVDHAFLLSPSDPRQAELHGNFIKAAKDAGVEHLVKFSAMNSRTGSAVEFYHQHGLSDDLVRGSGLGWTILQPNTFMQNFLRVAQLIKSQNAIFAPIGNAKISYVDVRDITAIAVKALTEPGHQGKVYVITGPESLTHSEIAAKFSGLLGCEIRFVDLPPAEYEKALRGFGLSEWEAHAVTQLYDDWRGGNVARVTTAVRDVTANEPIRFDRFLRDFKQAFV